MHHDHVDCVEDVDLNCRRKTDNSAVAAFAMAAVGDALERVYVTPVADWLRCAVCFDALSEPVSLPACGHTFCRGCVASVLARPAAQRKCPNCRKEVAPSIVAASLPLTWSVKAAIDELRVRCRFGITKEGDGWGADAAGCPAQLSLDGAAAHEATCGFAIIACPFAGCGLELRRSDVVSHNQACLRAHVGGEHAARVALEARQAACDTSSASRLAAMEARCRCRCLLSKSVCLPSLVRPRFQLASRMDGLCTAQYGRRLQSGAARSARTAARCVLPSKMALSSFSMLHRATFASRWTVTAVQ